ncbi:Trypanosomal VSG domain containing protein [Trypanosoma brucei equiperdum]|uniref:Trypanosomal VSG domain containing protein n=1 Tax=Trypanosoma brucei equiperdum TaxID=630700 RepID=A0A3L6L9Y2_9TRYP|nr:Trypanosomal VSG domain containing protein [Trypanosoma brucei equiperdum]
MDRLRNLIHTDTNHGYLGRFIQTQCDGTSGNGVCVKFDNYVRDGEKAFSKLPWIAPLEKLATELEEREQANAAAMTARQLLKMEATAAENAIAEAATAASVLATASALRTKITATQAANQCGKYRDNKTACENAKCKWKGESSEDKGDCQPKPETGNTEVGTVDQTGKKCSDYGNQ